jgi:hypothetical protein
MSVVRTWNLRPRAGRFEDAIGLLTEGAKLLDRHGARHIRLTHGGIAGNRSGAFVASCEFETLTAHGEFIDELMTDVENQAFMHRAREAEAPFTLESTALLTEVPLERTAKGGRGKVLEAFVTRVRPGCMQDALRLAATAFDVSERGGALGCRLFELMGAGELTGAHVSVIEYESMRDYGRVADAWLTDADARSVTDAVRGSSPPVDILSSGVYTEIPILG